MKESVSQTVRETDNKRDATHLKTQLVMILLVFLSVLLKALRTKMAIRLDYYENVLGFDFGYTLKSIASRRYVIASNVLNNNFKMWIH